MEISIALLGLFVGLLVGATGVGGASLLTPLLIIFGVNPSIAVGTDLLYNSVTKLFGTYQHFKQKTIDWKMVKYFAYGSLPGAVIAVGSLQIFEDQSQIIKHTLGVVLVLVALTTLLKSFFQNRIKDNRIQEKPLEQKIVMTIAIGFVLGFIVGLTSIGSGSMYAIVMLLLYRLAPSKIVGTDIAHAFLLVTVAGLLHAGLGNVDYGLALNLMLGSIPGVLLGSVLAVKLPARPLRTLMAILILISGWKMIGWNIF
ncbi:sulfite exporter TauE/SafE family protein [Paenibacillus sp. y28]|uniref:sulfite exporter TauE/SafE family protein n=1 Tax=Paenibacillus sp. y28 TaxID=3129110 RepID=UPI00301A1283